MTANCFLTLGKVFTTNGPGLYEILCLENNKRYIGESTNVLDRIARHGRSLQTSQADCAQLQLDFTQYGPDKFEVSILLCGPEWSREGSTSTQSVESDRSLTGAYGAYRGFAP
uniref:Putative GIY-YIG homing endonuclease n=1 Tax=Chlamydomonas applanata TaxID=35704 RepID=A0A0S2LQ48_CHLAP|nr:putative GIY-YIG homing endonuclease [Chlamydomonas applanata]